MAKLYYGSGNCTIEGNVIAIQLRFSGNIKIKDKTPDGVILMSRENGIIIAPIPLKGNKVYLNNLFDYIGEFKIISVSALGINWEKITTTIHRVMDYTELLTGNTESMTIPTEDMNATYISDVKVNKTTSNSNYVNNLNTKDWNMHLYLKSGLEYTGAFNISLKDHSVKTGNKRVALSDDLYNKIGGKLTPTKKSPSKRKEMLAMAKLKGRSKLRKFRKKLKGRR